MALQDRLNQGLLSVGKGQQGLLSVGSQPQMQGGAPFWNPSMGNVTPSAPVPNLPPAVMQQQQPVPSMQTQIQMAQLQNAPSPVTAQDLMGAGWYVMTGYGKGPRQWRLVNPTTGVSHGGFSSYNDALNYFGLMGI